MQRSASLLWRATCVCMLIQLISSDYSSYDFTLPGLPDDDSVCYLADTFSASYNDRTHPIANEGAALSLDWGSVHLTAWSPWADSLGTSSSFTECAPTGTRAVSVLRRTRHETMASMFVPGISYVVLDDYGRRLVWLRAPNADLPMTSTASWRLFMTPFPAQSAAALALARQSPDLGYHSELVRQSINYQTSVSVVTGKTRIVAADGRMLCPHAEYGFAVVANVSNCLWQIDPTSDDLLFQSTQAHVDSVNPHGTPGAVRVRIRHSARTLELGSEIMSVGSDLRARKILTTSFVFETPNSSYPRYLPFGQLAAPLGALQAGGASDDSAYFSPAPTLRARTLEQVFSLRNVPTSVRGKPSPFRRWPSTVTCAAGVVDPVFTFERSTWVSASMMCYVRIEETLVLGAGETRAYSVSSPAVSVSFEIWAPAASTLTIAQQGVHVLVDMGSTGLLRVEYLSQSRLLAVYVGLPGISASACDSTKAALVSLYRGETLVSSGTTATVYAVTGTPATELPRLCATGATHQLSLCWYNSATAACLSGGNPPGGGSPTTGRKQFIGTLARVVMWDRAITRHEVANNYRRLDSVLNSYTLRSTGELTAAPPTTLGESVYFLNCRPDVIISSSQLQWANQYGGIRCVARSVHTETSEIEFLPIFECHQDACPSSSFPYLCNGIAGSLGTCVATADGCEQIGSSGHAPCPELLAIFDQPSVTASRRQSQLQLAVNSLVATAAQNGTAVTLKTPETLAFDSATAQITPEADITAPDPAVRYTLPASLAWSMVVEVDPWRNGTEVAFSLGGTKVHAVSDTRDLDFDSLCFVYRDRSGPDEPLLPAEKIRCQDDTLFTDLAQPWSCGGVHGGKMMCPASQPYRCAGAVPETFTFAAAGTRLATTHYVVDSLGSDQSYFATTDTDTTAAQMGFGFDVAQVDGVLAPLATWTMANSSVLALVAHHDVIHVNSASSRLSLVGHAVTQTQRDPVHPGEHAIDQDPSTYTQAADMDSGTYTTPQWWSVDMGAVYDVVAVGIQTRGDYAGIYGSHSDYLGVYIDGQLCATTFGLAGTAAGSAAALTCRATGRYVNVSNLYRNARPTKVLLAGFPVTQSMPNSLFPGSLAVDGRADTTSFSGTLYSYTTPQSLTIDMISTRDVVSVSVQTRPDSSTSQTDRLGIYVSPTSTGPPVYCNRTTGFAASAPGTVLTFTCVLTGRYLMLANNAGEFNGGTSSQYFLSVAEVWVNVARPLAVDPVTNPPTAYMLALAELTVDVAAANSQVNPTAAVSLLNRPVTQTQSNPTFPGANAVDGQAGTFSHAADMDAGAYTTPQWWSVDMGGIYDTVSVVVQTRSDLLGAYSLQTDGLAMYIDGRYCGMTSGFTGAPASTTRTLPCRARGRYLNITNVRGLRNSASSLAYVLTLAEVSVNVGTQFRRLEAGAISTMYFARKTATPALSDWWYGLSARPWGRVVWNSSNVQWQTVDDQDALGRMPMQLYRCVDTVAAVPRATSWVAWLYSDTYMNAGFTGIASDCDTAAIRFPLGMTADYTVPALDTRWPGLWRAPFPVHFDYPCKALTSGCASTGMASCASLTGSNLNAEARVVTAIELASEQALCVYTPPELHRYNTTIGLGISGMYRQPVSNGQRFQLVQVERNGTSVNWNLCSDESAWCAAGTLDTVSGIDKLRLTGELLAVATITNASILLPQVAGGTLELTKLRTVDVRACNYSSAQYQVLCDAGCSAVGDTFRLHTRDTVDKKLCLTLRAQGYAVPGTDLVWETCDATSQQRLRIRRMGFVADQGVAQLEFVDFASACLYIRRIGTVVLRHVLAVDYGCTLWLETRFLRESVLVDPDDPRLYTRIVADGMRQSVTNSNASDPAWPMTVAMTVDATGTETVCGDYGIPNQTSTTRHFRPVVLRGAAAIPWNISNTFRSTVSRYGDTDFVFGRHRTPASDQVDETPAPGLPIGRNYKVVTEHLGTIPSAPSAPWSQFVTGAQSMARLSVTGHDRQYTATSLDACKRACELADGCLSVGWVASTLQCTHGNQRSYLFRFNGTLKLRATRDRTLNEVGAAGAPMWGIVYQGLVSVVTGQRTLVPQTLAVAPASSTISVVAGRETHAICAARDYYLVSNTTLNLTALVVSRDSYPYSTEAARFHLRVDEIASNSSLSDAQATVVADLCALDAKVVLRPGLVYVNQGCLARLAPGRLYRFLAHRFVTDGAPDDLVVGLFYAQLRICHPAAVTTTLYGAALVGTQMVAVPDSLDDFRSTSALSLRFSWVADWTVCPQMMCGGTVIDDSYATDRSAAQASCASMVDFAGLPTCSGVECDMTMTPPRCKRYANSPDASVCDDEVQPNFNCYVSPDFDQAMPASLATRTLSMFMSARDSGWEHRSYAELVSDQINAVATRAGTVYTAQFSAASLARARSDIPYVLYAAMRDEPTGFSKRVLKEDIKIMPARQSCQTLYSSTQSARSLLDFGDASVNVTFRPAALVASTTADSSGCRLAVDLGNSSTQSKIRVLVCNNTIRLHGQHLSLSDLPYMQVPTCAQGSPPGCTVTVGIDLDNVGTGLGCVRLNGTLAGCKQFKYTGETWPAVKARQVTYAGYSLGARHAKTCGAGMVVVPAAVCQQTLESMQYAGLLAHAPTSAPTNAPTTAPTWVPSSTPSASPTEAPTETPTETPTESPTEAPTGAPTTTRPPTRAPTSSPSLAPTSAPSAAPTTAPSAAPSSAPTTAPSTTPTGAPTTTVSPTKTPTTAAPSTAPTTVAPTTAAPSTAPSSAPTTKAPTKAPTTPTTSPTTPYPSFAPSTSPTQQPTGSALRVANSITMLGGCMLNYADASTSQPVNNTARDTKCPFPSLASCCPVNMSMAYGNTSECGIAQDNYTSGLVSSFTSSCVSVSGTLTGPMDAVAFASVPEGTALSTDSALYAQGGGNCTLEVDNVLNTCYAGRAWVCGGSVPVCASAGATCRCVPGTNTTVLFPQQVVGMQGPCDTDPSLATRYYSSTANRMALRTTGATDVVISGVNFQWQESGKAAECTYNRTRCGARCKSEPLCGSVRLSSDGRCTLVNGRGPYGPRTPAPHTTMRFKNRTWYLASRSPGNSGTLASMTGVTAFGGYHPDPMWGDRQFGLQFADRAWTHALLTSSDNTVWAVADRAGLADCGTITGYTPTEMSGPTAQVLCRRPPTPVPTSAPSASPTVSPTNVPSTAPTDAWAICADRNCAGTDLGPYTTTLSNMQIACQQWEHDPQNGQDWPQCSAVECDMSLMPPLCKRANVIGNGDPVCDNSEEVPGTNCYVSPWYTHPGTDAGTHDCCTVSCAHEHTHVDSHAYRFP